MFRLFCSAETQREVSSLIALCCAVTDTPIASDLTASDSEDDVDDVDKVTPIVGPSITSDPTGVVSDRGDNVEAIDHDATKRDSRDSRDSRDLEDLEDGGTRDGRQQSSINPSTFGVVDIWQTQLYQNRRYSIFDALVHLLPAQIRLLSCDLLKEARRFLIDSGTAPSQPQLYNARSVHTSRYDRNSSS